MKIYSGENTAKAHNLRKLRQLHEHDACRHSTGKKDKHNGNESQHFDSTVCMCAVHVFCKHCGGGGVGPQI